MQSNDLHVVAVYFNPVRWQSRERLFRQFAKHMKETDTKLTIVECQLGEQPFIFHDLESDLHVKVRSKTLVWNKENLGNIGIAATVREFPGTKYFGWIDSDIKFRQHDWAAQAVDSLQQYEIIQPWSDCYDLGPKDSHMAHHKSFCRLLWEDKPVVGGGKNWWKFDGGPYDYAHTGYAWCFTRSALEWLGGLIEFAAMGAGDHHMALSLIGKADRSVPGGVNSAYMRHLLEWQKRAMLHINQNIGFNWGTIEHNFHGAKQNRKYIERWDMIVEQQFNPDTDIKKNIHGVMELTGNKPRLSHLLDVYFRSRNEDANTIG